MVYREQVNMLYGALPSSLSIVMVNAAVVSYVLWGNVESGLTLSWLMLVLLVVLR